MKHKVFIFLFLFSQILFAQASDSLVLLKDIDSTIITDVKYATKENFTGKILYPTDKVYLRKIVAEALAQVNQYLKKNYALRLKVFDGYRPLSVQKKMWEIYPDERYVADPAKGSRHNRGAAVDLTLVDATEKEIDMGTPYDDFTEKAHIDYKKLPRNVLDYRKILRTAVERFGFTAMSTEWWHFDFKGWDKFPILDVEIK